MDYFDLEDDNEDEAFDLQGAFDDNDTDSADNQLADFDSFGDNANSNDNSVSTKGIAKFAIIGGVVIFIVAIVFIGMTNKAKNGDKGASTETDTVVMDETPVTNRTFEQESAGSTIPDENTVSGKDEWIELDREIVKFDKNVESTMTITSIKFYASIKSEDSIGVKCSVSGNISGLVGTYSADIAYSKGLRLKIGSVNKVTYSIGELNGKLLVDNIELK